MGCGVDLEELASQGSEDTFEHEEGFDLDDRVLCPDGTCTGIIIDGKCTECGRSHRESEGK
jgi:hypothetical protein